MTTSEKSGLHFCEAPNCMRQIKTAQARRVRQGDREILTCHDSICAGWADEQAAMVTS